MKPKLSVLIPTRGRTDMLDRSLSSLLEHADDPSTIEFLFAFDDDDSASQEYFLERTVPIIILNLLSFLILISMFPQLEIINISLVFYLQLNDG